MSSADSSERRRNSRSLRLRDRLPQNNRDSRSRANRRLSDATASTFFQRFGSRRQGTVQSRPVSCLPRSLRQEVNARYRNSSTRPRSIPRSRIRYRPHCERVAGSTARAIPVVRPMSGMERHSACTQLHVTTVPQLQHEEDIQQVSKIGRTIVLHLAKQVFDELSSEIASLVGPGVKQDFIRPGPQLPIRLQPQSNRKSEAMFLFLQNRRRKKSTSCLFKQVTLLQAANLEIGPQTSGKLRQGMVEIRKSDLNSGERRHARHFRQVVVAQSHLEVNIKEPVEF